MPSQKFDPAGFIAGILSGVSQQWQHERAQNEARQLRLLQLLQQNENYQVQPANPADVVRTGGLLGALTGTGGGRLRTTGAPVTMVAGTPFVAKEIPFFQAPPAPQKLAISAPTTTPRVTPARLPSGRQVVQNPDGTVSTHRNIIVNIDGREALIPTMFGGQQVPEAEAVRRVKAAGMRDPETGQPIPTFATVADARAYEQQQHATLEQQTGGGQTLEPVTVSAPVDILATAPVPSLTDLQDLAEYNVRMQVAGKFRQTDKGKQYVETRVEKARDTAAKDYERGAAAARREADQLLKRVHRPEVVDALQRLGSPAELAVVKQFMAENPEPNYVQHSAALIQGIPPEQRSAVIATEYAKLLEMGYDKAVIEAQFRPFMKTMEKEEKGELEEYLGNIRNRQRYELEAALQPLKRQVARETGLAAALQKPIEFQDRRRLLAFETALATQRALATEFTPEERKKYVGLFGLRVKAKNVEEAIKEATGQQTDPKFHRFGALAAIALREIRGEAGANFTEIEREDAYGWLLSGKEWTSESFEQKLQFGLQRLPRDIERNLYLLKTPLGQVTPEGLVGAPFAPPKTRTAPLDPKTLTPADLDAMTPAQLQQLRDQLKKGK